MAVIHALVTIILVLMIYILIFLVLTFTDKSKTMNKKHSNVISFFGLPVNEKTLYKTIDCTDDTTLYFYEAYKMTFLNENNEIAKEYSGLSRICTEKIKKRFLPSKNIVRWSCETGFLIELHNNNGDVIYSEEYNGCFIEAQDYALERFKNALICNSPSSAV